MKKVLSVCIILIGGTFLLIPKEQQLTNKQKLYTALYEDLKDAQEVRATQEGYRHWYIKNGMLIHPMDEKDYQYNNQQIRFLKERILRSL